VPHRVGTARFQRPGHRCAPSRPRPRAPGRRALRPLVRAVDGLPGRPLERTAGREGPKPRRRADVGDGPPRVRRRVAGAERSARRSALVTAPDPLDGLEIDLTDHAARSREERPAATAPASGAAPAPRQRSMLRSVALPSEHGGWGLTGEPIVLGLLL